MKHLHLIAFLFLSISFAQAQNCTPSWSGTGSGLSPDSATNLPHAYAGSPYSAVINFKVPKDTTVGVVKANIVDITIDSVKGFGSIPATVPFNFVSNPSNHVFKGDSVGCILITGTPTLTGMGTYQLKVYVTGHGKLKIGNVPVSLPSTIDYYFIQVEYPVGINDVTNNEFSVFAAQPNPTNASTVLSYYLPQQGSVNLKVYSMLGQLVADKNLSSLPGLNNYTLNTGDVPAGQYFYTLSSKNGRQTRVFSVVK